MTKTTYTILIVALFLVGCGKADKEKVEVIKLDSYNSQNNNYFYPGNLYVYHFRDGKYGFLNFAIIINLESLNEFYKYCNNIEKNNHTITLKEISDKAFTLSKSCKDQTLVAMSIGSKSLPMKMLRMFTINTFVHIPEETVEQSIMVINENNDELIFSRPSKNMMKQADKKGLKIRESCGVSQFIEGNFKLQDCNKMINGIMIEKIQNHISEYPRAIRLFADGIGTIYLLFMDKPASQVPSIIPDDACRLIYFISPKRGVKLINHRFVSEKKKKSTKGNGNVRLL